MSDQGNTKRVDFTIGDHELGFGRVRGETVSSYIGRLHPRGQRWRFDAGSDARPHPNGARSVGCALWASRRPLRSRIKAVLIDLAQD